MKRLVLVVAFAAVAVLAFGVGKVVGAPPGPLLSHPGGHSFALIPPNQFPPAGTSDVVSIVGTMEVTYDDGNCVVGEPVPVDVAGWMLLHEPDAPDDSGPSTVMDIEMQQMELVGMPPSGFGCGGPGEWVMSLANPSQGQLVDPTDQPNGAFPAIFQVSPELQLDIPGLDPLTATDPINLVGRTIGWPPVGIGLDTDPLGLPLVLETPAMDPVAVIEELTVLPATPAQAFMKGEAIRHEAETAESVEQVQEAVDGLSDEVGMLGQSLEADLEAQAERMLQEEERARGADTAEAKRLRRVLALLRKLQ